MTKGSTIKITTDNSVINGKGATIDMAGSSIRAFTVSASGVTIKNLTIKNAKYEGDGGAVYFSASGTVRNCNFINNTASNGDAIYFDYNYDFNDYKYNIRGTVENCNFVNNSATNHGGAINIYFGTITNCNFVNNFACYGGAVDMGSGTVENCSFTNNSALEGSALCVTDSEVINCNFTHNSAYSNGGAIDLMRFGNVTSCNFINNSAEYGGAIYFDYVSSYGNVTGCNFTDNFAEYGGAICSSGNMTISNSLFLNNRANVDDSAPLQIVKNENNICITFKGQNNLLNAIYSSNDVNFTNVTYWGANGITNTGSSPTAPSRSNNVTGQNITVIVVVNDIILLNTTKVTDDNGQIILETPIEGRYTITACHDADSYYSQAETTKTIVHPSNTYSELAGEIGFGGNVELKHDYYGYDHGDTIKITVDNSVIDGNGAIIDMVGSDIQVFNITASGVTVKNLTIIDTDFDGDGGAIYFSKQGCIENCNFVNNNASRNGGAIYFNENATVTKCNFTNNAATWQGGAIYFNYNYDYYCSLTATIENCNFANNKAGFGNGGAIDFNYYVYFAEGPDYNFPGTTYYYSILSTIENCNFVNNTADYGGAIYLIYSDSYGNTCNVTNCNFSVNTALHGGAVYFVDGGDVANCNFNSNQATVGGAIYFHEHSTGSVLNSKFTNNTASEDGGAIYIDYGTVENCKFTNNKATSGDGGAIYVLNSRREIWDQVYTDYISYVTDCNFINNTAYLGGAVYLLNYCKATGCNFINNTAYRGGAIWIFRGTVTNCSFITCSASNYGGGIYFESGSCKMYGCHFKDNNAKKGSNWWHHDSLTNIESPKVTATYSVSKKLTATLNDGNGKSLKNKKVSVTIGTISKTLKTNAKGQISVDVSFLVPKTYTATIKFKGDNKYKASSTTVKVTVKKATPKITSKAKTFKKSVKTKKYTITLKNNKNKAMKNTKVAIKVNKKIYTAQTNKNGVATFKITKLNKKGAFKSTVTYKGNKYYNKVTKKVNIKVK